MKYHTPSLGLAALALALTLVGCVTTAPLAQPPSEGKNESCTVAPSDLSTPETYKPLGWVIETGALTPLAEETGVLSRSLSDERPSYFVFDRIEPDKVGPDRLVRTRITLGGEIYASERWELSPTPGGEVVTRFTTEGYTAEYDYDAEGVLIARRIDFNNVAGWDINETLSHPAVALLQIPTPPPSPSANCYGLPPSGLLASYYMNEVSCSSPSLSTRTATLLVDR